jgi:hypothetical protein
MALLLACVWRALDQRLLLKVGKKLESAFDVMNEIRFTLQPCSHDTVHKLKAMAGNTGSQMW